MKQGTADRKLIIEQNKRFSHSALWKMQREYFDKEGINAWTNQVPFYITSNPFIADCYAQLVLGFMRDWISKNSESIHSPFYIMELGTGSGRFSYFFVKRLSELFENLNIKEIKFCYIMSDFTKHNIQYYETHHALKPFIDKGLIDFALFDMEVERPITLIKSQIRLSQDILVNPLTVFANYIFDTVSHDSFAVHQQKLYELTLSLATEESNLKNNKPVEMEKVSVDYNVHEIKHAYYNDPSLDLILDEYKKTLSETSFLIPIGSINAINYLKKLSNNNLFLISTDKGYSTLDALDHLGHPSISFHGSFSMMVNFHAIASYFKNTNGDAYLQTSRKGIKTSVFSSGFKLTDMPQTWLAILERVEKFSPADYFILHRRISDSFNECNMDTIASHMQLAGWDPHIYLKLTNRVISLVSETDGETLGYMADNMPKLAANYYFMPKSECILFEIGVFFHALKRYKEAAKYYQEALPFVGEQFGLFYNLALCQHHLQENSTALDNFKKAFALDSNSKETEEWIKFLEKPDSNEQKI